jgi:hypothetical protein
MIPRYRLLVERVRAELRSIEKVVARAVGHPSLFPRRFK